MRFSFVPAAALALMIAPAAYADVVYNTNLGPVAGADGNVDGVTAIAASFAAPAVPVTQVGLLLSDLNPADGGSFSVYIVPDDGSGGATGVAGNPTFTSTTPTSGFTGFSGAELLGTLLDNSLTATPTLTDFAVTSLPSTLDGEYWVGLVPSSGSGAAWSYNDASQAANFIGTGGQSNWFFNQTDIAGNGTPLGANVSTVASLAYPLGPYDLVVSAPEPMSIALLGVGMAGLGFARRRVAKKA